MPETRVTTVCVALMTIIVVATVARFLELDGNSVWSDELYSLTFSRPDLSPERFWYLAGEDVHPPFYMTLLYLHFQAFPFTVEFGRGLSAFFGALGIVAIYLAARVWIDRSSSLVAAAVTAVHNLHFFYSQELRSYALVFLLSATGVWLWGEVARRDRFLPAVLTGLCFAMLAWTHYFGALFAGLFLGFGAGLELYYSKRLRGHSVAVIAVFAAGVIPLLPWILGDLGTSQFWTGIPSWGDILFLLVQLLGGKLAVIISLLIVIWAGTIKFSLNKWELHHILVIVSFLAVVIGYSFLRYSVLIPRFSIAVLPLVILVLGTALSRLPARNVVGLALIAALSYPTLLAPVNAFDRRGHGHDLKALVDEVTRSRSGEPVFSDRENLFQTLFDVYGYPDIEVSPIEQHPHDERFWIVVGHTARSAEALLPGKNFRLLKSIKHNREAAYLLEIE